MAKTTTTSVSDDIDGTPDAETVTFGFQGVSYSIDLAQKNLDKLTKLLTPFIENATRQRGAALSVAGGKRRTKAKAERPYEISDLREWAGKNKIKVPQRGRIPAAVVEQYLAAGRR
jgi:hypothetical protein